MINNAERTILVLDDDLLFCNLLEMEFERDGFDLLACNSPTDALRLLQKDSGMRFDMIRPLHMNYRTRTIKIV